MLRRLERLPPSAGPPSSTRWVYAANQPRRTATRRSRTGTGVLPVVIEIGQCPGHRP